MVTYTADKSYQVCFELNTKPATRNLVVFKLTKKSIRSGKSRPIQGRQELSWKTDGKGEQQGFAYPSNIKDFLTNNDETVREAIAFKEGHFLLVTSGFLEWFRKNEWACAEEWEKYIEPKIIQKPFDNLEKGIIVQVVNYDHTLRTPDGKFYPVGVRFDYISAYIHNACYDLKKALHILSKRKDIQIWTRGIEEIPYYNRDEHRTHCLEFTWSPGTETYRKLKKRQGENGSSSEFFKAVFDMDVLGLRSAALFKNFWKSKED